jgi:hypothetical protein
MHNGQNLIDIKAPDVKKYGLRVASVVFSEAELAEGVINPTKKRTNRRPLDQKKVDLVKQAVLLKYKLTVKQFDQLLWPVICSSINAKGRNIKRKLALSSKTDN